MPDLEERVAALEAAMAAPVLDLSEMIPLTEKQVTELGRQFDEAMQQQRERPFAYNVLSSVPPLTPDQIRHLLRECVTVVKPGETLVVRVGFDLRPEQVRELQVAADDMCEYRDFPFKVLVFPGEELAVAEPGEVPGAA